VNKESADWQVKMELVGRAAYNSNNATRQWDIERRVKKSAKEAHVSTELREIRDFVEINYGDASDEFAPELEFRDSQTPDKLFLSITDW
jgi:hypothetical protein